MIVTRTRMDLSIGHTMSEEALMKLGWDSLVNKGKPKALKTPMPSSPGMPEFLIWHGAKTLRPDVPLPKKAGILGPTFRLWWYDSIGCTSVEFFLNSTDKHLHSFGNPETVFTFDTFQHTDDQDIPQTYTETSNNYWGVKQASVLWYISTSHGKHTYFVGDQSGPSLINIPGRLLDKVIANNNPWTPYVVDFWYQREAALRAYRPNFGRATKANYLDVPPSYHSGTRLR